MTKGFPKSRVPCPSDPVSVDMESLKNIPQILNPSAFTKYNEARFSYRRRFTREVKVGDIGIGGANPIRIQSMTTSDTMDTKATIQQTIALYEAGCEIVRITAPSIKDAQNLKNIRDGLRKAGIKIPLVADIHFTPNAAVEAANYVEKVRINPGNYADKKKFAVLEYSNSAYDAELLRIEETFKPLVLKCKENGVAMRIGTNHGSLSDRIMNRYGDTPIGMVESALEFVRICEAYGYKEIVLSMKSSNTQVMIAAYRLLAARMYELDMDYPFHLGVTEAGDGEDGRIKSAVGIGALLEDGLGDTIRVSLTEDSVFEIPAARAIAKRINGSRMREQKDRLNLERSLNESRNPFQYGRRWTQTVETPPFNWGGVHLVRVGIHDRAETSLETCLAGDTRAELIYRTVLPESELNNFSEYKTIINKGGAALAINARHHLTVALASAAFADVVVFCPERGLDEASWSRALRSVIEKLHEKQALEISLSADSIPEFAFGESVIEAMSVTASHAIRVCAEFKNFSIGLHHKELVYAARAIAARLAKEQQMTPLILHWTPNKDADHETLFESATALGSLLCDGIGDAVVLDDPGLGVQDILRLSYNILQATRLRISKTEFISCPSCGRTLFDLQEVTARIKSKTGHLKGVKIAIMGCIVNGPGEMADADFGYVGASAGKINLYVGKDLVERNIDMAEADGKLIDLIKTKGVWIDNPN